MCSKFCSVVFCRDNYDKEVKSKLSERPKRYSFEPPRTKRPDAATYIPPPRLEPTANGNNQESSEGIKLRLTPSLHVLVRKL